MKALELKTLNQIRTSLDLISLEETAIHIMKWWSFFDPEVVDMAERFLEKSAKSSG